MNLVRRIGRPLEGKEVVESHEEEGCSLPVTLLHTPKHAEITL